MSKQEIRKEDFGELILDESMSIKDIYNLAADELGLDLEAKSREVGRELTRVEILDLVWERYLFNLKSMNILPGAPPPAKKQVKRKSPQAPNKPIVGSIPENNAPPESLKKAEYIRNLVRADRYTEAEICKLLDVAYNYKAEGKTPRVRVRKTLEALVAKNQAFRDTDGVWKWGAKP